MNITRRQKLVIYLLLLLLSFLGLLYFFYFKESKSINFINNSKVDIDKANEAEIKRKSIKENDAYVALRAAETEKNIERCKSLRKQDIDRCYFSIAFSSNDKKICDLISSEDVKKNCFENFIFQEAINGNNVRLCYNFATSSKEDCLHNYFRNFKDVKECYFLDEADKQKCFDLVNSISAFNLGDDSVCNSVVDDLTKENCKKVIKNKPIDTDKDGLSDSDERSYGTNPLNSDSDNDSILDYDEIFKYRTNPLKKDSKENAYDDGV